MTLRRSCRHVAGPQPEARPGSFVAGALLALTATLVLGMALEVIAIRHL
jgi:hypothetical protein